MDDGDAIPAAPEDLMQMNEAPQASVGGGCLVFAATCSAADGRVKFLELPSLAVSISPRLEHQCLVDGTSVWSTK